MADLDKRKVLVTGSSGFIGLHLVRHLHEAGASVTRLQRRLTDDGTGTRCIVTDGLSARSLDAAFAQVRPDVVFHLAGYGIAPGNRDLELMRALNISASEAVVTVAAQHGVLTVVATGSGSEYDFAGCTAPVDETHATLTTAMLSDPKHAYGASKAEGGRKALARARDMGLGYVHARLFNTYGPGEGAHRLLPSLHSSLRRGERVKLSAGTQMRDFMHVGDTCTALTALALASVDKPRAMAVNVATGSPRSVKEFGLAVAAAMGCAADMLDFGALPLREGETMFFSGTSDVLQRLTSWRPQFSLEAGISDAIRSLDGA